MKYGVKIFNYLKGMYEVAVFNDKSAAERCFRMMQDLENNTDLTEDEASAAYAYALNESIGYEDYWDCKSYRIKFATQKIKKFKYSTNDNGKVNPQISNLTFVFNGQYVEVPA